MKKSNKPQPLSHQARQIRKFQPPERPVRRVLSALLTGVLIAASLLSGAARAQADEPEGPVYVVQEGDSLWDIALRFGVTMDDLKQANDISDANQLALGSHLLIPGLEGIQGMLVTEKVPFGETLRSISRRYQVAPETLARLNHLTSPAELYPGASLIIPEQNAAASAARRAALGAGQSLLELAVIEDTNPWTLAQANQLPGQWAALPGDVLQVPGQNTEGPDAGAPGALPAGVASISIAPTILVQGKAAAIRVSGPAGLELSGTLQGYELNFFSAEPGSYAAVQGIHAMAEPGLYPLVLHGALPGGEEFDFSQSVFVRSGDYYFDPVLIVSAETIDPAVTAPEDAEWKALAAPRTPDKLWSGVFQSPVPPPFQDCWPSVFGNRRSYNGSAYEYFHTGLDFCGGVGTEIFAPAAGRVVFAGPLTVRGNATMIDHGWGIYTGYMHQDEILVEPGEMVEAGQLIGRVGGTGRVTGPHLHWEVFAGGVNVDPLDWLQQEFP